MWPCQTAWPASGAISEQIDLFLVPGIKRFFQITPADSNSIYGLTSHPFKITLFSALRARNILSCRIWKWFKCNNATIYNKKSLVANFSISYSESTIYEQIGFLQLFNFSRSFTVPRKLAHYSSLVLCSWPWLTVLKLSISYNHDQIGTAVIIVITCSFLLLFSQKTSSHFCLSLALFGNQIWASRCEIETFRVPDMNEMAIFWLWHIVQVGSCYICHTHTLLLISDQVRSSQI